MKQGTALLHSRPGSAEDNFKARLSIVRRSGFEIKQDQTNRLKLGSNRDLYLVQGKHYASLRAMKIAELAMLSLNTEGNSANFDPMAAQRFSESLPSQSKSEDFSNYVAHLQLHMSLQARNLVPRMSQPQDSRTAMLQETQALCEKQISRQA